MDYTFHWRPVFRKWPDLLEAGLVTMEVAILALLMNRLRSVRARTLPG